MRISYNIIKALLAIVFCIGCEEILFEQDISDETITIFAPRNGVTIDDSSVNFSWSEIDGNEAYEFQIVQPNFENATIITESATLETNEHSITGLDTGTYEWRVRAINSNSETQYTHAQITITENENFSERSLNLTYPEDNFYTNQLSINFEWENVSDATLYLSLIHI